MYTRGAKPNTIMVAIIKSQPSKAFMLSTTARNFTSTDSARNYFQHLIADANPTSESAKLFKQIFKNKGGWSAFTFKMKEYQDMHSADRAFKRFKVEYEIQNRPKNCFKSVNNEPTNNRPVTPEQVAHRVAQPGPTGEVFNGDEAIIAAVLAGRTVTFGGVQFHLRLEPVKERA